MPDFLLNLTERQHKLLPKLAARYDMGSSSAFIRAAIDAAIDACAEHDLLTAAMVEMADRPAPTLPAVKPPVIA